MSGPARLLIIAFFAVAFGASAFLLFDRPSPPPPPSLSDPSRVDSEVAASVQSALDAIQSAPGSSAQRIRLGHIYNANGLSTPAESAYEQAIAVGANDPKVWYYLAQTRADQGDLAGALSAIGQSIKLDSNYAPSHWQRGFWLLDLDQLDDAQMSFENSLEVKRAQPFGDIPARVGLARIALHRQEFSRATDLLGRIMAETGATTPNLPYIRQLLGTAQRALGQPTAASHLAASGNLASPTEGAREKPIKWPDEWSAQLASYIVGRRAALDQLEHLIATSQFGLAISRANELLKQNPEDIALLNWLAIAQISSGQVDQGIATLQRALDVDPNHYATHLNLAETLGSKGDLAAALDHAQRAANLNPGAGRAHLAAGRLLLRSQQPQDAIVALTRAVEAGANSTEVRVPLGQTLIDLGRFPEAVKVLEQAARTDHQAAEVFAALALARAETGQLPAARLALQRAMQLDSALPSLSQIAARIARLEATHQRSISEPRP